MRKDKFCLFWKHLYIFRETSDLRYSDFDCGYWTGWILSNFPATLILGEINFGWFQKVKNCPFNNFEGFELWFYEKRYAWKCRKFPNIQNSELLKWSKWQFWGFKMTKIDFMKYLGDRKSWIIHIMYSQLGCPGLYALTNQKY